MANVPLYITQQSIMAKWRLSANQAEILLHTIGWPTPYRNYFAASKPSKDYSDIEVLVSIGLMEPFISRDHDSGLSYFRVTEYFKNVLSELGKAEQLSMLKNTVE